ncbi:hypothetical protein IQ260_09305 [Leptolyngbya cf. ectocarpi LEGE 11479]|uniref:Uncharacterized protein n=1 Tax=Leptolyngbya cf. ectocarpi LEGE 11479 TaxID=1828722 RepID=A0A928X0P2_LEPEC|nr:hypothetical protein [Leptolyngbya ectocarpi]MBE9066849.1 hypothetical protein [Leptolyngbya cf. ectocarpi LEGE 11479]
MPHTAHNSPPDVIEIQASMCQAAQPGTPQPIARWILEEGQLLGVLVASFPSPLFQKTISTC